MKLSELFEAVEERSVLSVLGEFPDSTKTFICNNKGLTSLKGSPSSVETSFDCHDNELTSLEGAPSFIGGNFFCYNNNLTSLHNIHKIIRYIGGCAYFNNCPITSHVLGLLLIDGLEEVYFTHGWNDELQTIINKHLKGDRDVFACQEELIENGLEESLEDFAQL